jgi:hypothetical protein
MNRVFIYVLMKIYGNKTTIKNKIIRGTLNNTKVKK